MANTCFQFLVIIFAYFVVSLCFFLPHSTALHGSGVEEGGGSVPVPLPAKHGTMVTKDQRWSVSSSEFGDISAVKVSDGRDGFYHLQFITMEPNSLFLPAHLHSDMVFYVDSGSGILSWVDLEKDSDKLRQVDLRPGDVYRLRTGSFFYLQSNLDSDRRKLRIHAIFSDAKEEIREGSSFGAYSSVRELVLGFDDKVLQAALNVDEEVIQELRSGGRQPMIVHGVSKVEPMLNVHYRIMRTFFASMENDMIDVSKNKNKKDKAYNILEAKHDVENCNGWSLVVTSKQLDALKDSDFGIFLVNLTKGAMMGPHWNPLTAEIAVVLSGRGMVHVVCPSTVDETECKNSRFRVEEGDVFVVPRYHPMAQISFNNGSFVFVGFTTTQKNNHPQYLVGSASVFQVLDKRVIAASLGVSNTTMDEILSAQREAIILECTSCAEEEERLMEEEIQRQKEEEARQQEEEARREQEEAQKREEEEARREEEEARREQQEAQKREEEEAARQQAEQEAKRRQEEEEARRQQEEEEAARQQEEDRRQQEEDRKRQEEEAARQQEEAYSRRQQEEEAARKQEEEARRQWQQEEEAARQQEEDRRRQEEAAARQQEEAYSRRQQEEEAARKQEEEARRQWQQEEEAARQRQQEEAARQKEQARRRWEEEEEARQQREQEEEAARRRQQEEEATRQLEEEVRRRQEEAARKRQEHEEAGRRGQGEAESARQQEEARRRQQEGEAARRWQHEEEAREEAEGRRREEEKAASRGGGGGRGRGHRGQAEGEAASKGEEEMAQRESKRESEAATRGREAGGGITAR